MSDNENEKALSIWTWVGIILCIYGIIITSMGVYYHFAGHPQTVLAETNPSLWWGAIILFGGILLWVVGKKK